MKPLITLAVVVVCMSIGAALADDAFRSIRANGAAHKYATELKRLGDDYQQRVVEAKRAYLSGLKEALKDAAKVPNPDTDEITRISAKIKELETTMQAAPDRANGGVKADDLAGRTFVFAAYSSPVVAQWTFERNGQLKGNSDAHEGFWKAENGKVVLLDKNNHASAILDVCRRGDATWFCEFSGTGVGSAGQIHTLYPAGKN